MNGGVWKLDITLLLLQGRWSQHQAIRVPREGQLQMMIENCWYKFDGHWRQLNSMKSSPDSRVH